MAAEANGKCRIGMSSRERLKVRVSKFRDPERKRYWKPGGNPVERTNRLTGGGNG